MSQLKITNAGLIYKDLVFAGTETQNITHFVFANIAGLNEGDVIDPNMVIPINDLVHTQPINRVSALDGNAVVMSAVLGYDVGNFEFNWFGAVATKADNSQILIAVVQTALQTKTKTVGPSVGNYSVKSIVWRSQNIAGNLNVTLSALPWQLNDGAFTSKADFDAHNHDSNYLAKSKQSEIDTAQATADTKWSFSLASLINYGAVKLSSAINSTSEVLAATPKAVKLAYDKAVSAFDKATLALSTANSKLDAGSTAVNSDRLNGQLHSYYEDIPARLGYTPLSENINVDVSVKNNKKLTFGNAGEVEEYFNGNDFNTKVKTGSHYRYAQNYSYEFINDTLQGFWNYIGLNLPDQKELRLGNSADLRLFSTGLNSYIQNETGEFHLRNTSDGGDVFITSKTTGGVLHTGFAVIADVNVYAQQYYNGQLRTKTTDAGFDVTGFLIINGKGAISGDDWLRINEHSQHASGIYTGNSKIRTDNAIEVGANGITFKVDQYDITYKGNKVYHEDYKPTIADISSLESRLQSSMLASGTLTDDPNTTLKPHILTAHANNPDVGKYFYVETVFWSNVTGNSNCRQIATTYNDSTPEMYVRSRYGSTWYPWVRCDLGGEAASATTADNVAGYIPASAGTFSPNSIVTRDSNGYIHADYFNTRGSYTLTTAPTAIFIEQGSDGYIRKQTPKLLLQNLNVRTNLSLSNAISQTLQGSIGSGVNNLTLKNHSSVARTYHLSAVTFADDDVIEISRLYTSAGVITIVTDAGNFYFDNVNRGNTLTMSNQPHKLVITKDVTSFLIEIIVTGEA
jgi:hypothetical protein